ncbi:MAG: GNAT family N-acetyltransferase [Thermoplasmata archaeon]|nr:MAG: GNAT family N-acetyltransferase [Thermoplasmata archaeon]
MNIRVAEQKDIEDIVNLSMEFESYLDELESTPDSEKISKQQVKEVFSEGFSDPKHVILVAEEEEDIVGFSDFWVYPEMIHGGLSAYLNNLFVTPKFQRKGIGSQLLTEILKRSKEMGAVALHISVLPENIIAQNFYKKNGITWEIKMFEVKLK